METLHDKRFPGESDSYRRAREGLLEAEIELRRKVEDVAAMRRRLPPGGKLAKDYVFQEGAAEISEENFVKEVRFSELFEGDENSLIVYSFMYGPGEDAPCPMCTSLLDSLNGGAPHASQNTNLVVAAKAPIRKIRDWARRRGWNNLRLLSSANNSYNLDYFAETAEGEQLPDINVFQKTGAEIFHFYNAELFFVPPEEGQNPRHADMIWPLWNLLDLTPEGRRSDWYPAVSYT